LSQRHVATSGGGSCATACGAGALGRWVFHLFGLLGLLTDDRRIEFFTTAGKDLFDVLSSLGRRLEALMDTVLSCELDSAVKVDLSSRLKFAFVTD